MYLHLGEGEVIPSSEIIGIFDLDNISVSPRSREFLAAAEKRGKVRTVGRDIPRGVVVTADTVYLTQIGSGTLARRA